MTIQQLQVLRLLYKLTERSEKTFFYDENDQSLVLFEYDGKITCSKLSHQILGLLENLQSKGYVEKLPDRYFSIDDKLLRLTYKGLHPMHFSLESFVAFLIKSVAVPVIVAFITSLLVSALPK